MIIRSIKLKNFRQYIDSSIDFSVNPQKNITIIMGDNGTGKTTLAQAFQWVLYGITQFQIKELLNRKVREQMTNNFPDNEKVVSVALELIYNEINYTIRRSITYRKSGAKIEESGPAKFTISYVNKDNGNIEYIPDHQKEYLIKSILPKDLSKFFFFDGEKIEDMSKSIQEGKGDDFKEAVYGLVGLSSVQNAIKHLYAERSSANSVIKSLRTELEANSKSNAALKGYNEEIERLEVEIEKYTNQKEELKLELAKIKHAIDENQRVILSETPKMELKESYERLEKEIARLKKDRNVHLAKVVLRQFKTGFYGYVTSPVMNNEKIKDLLEKSVPEDKIIPDLRRKTLDFLLERKKCICGTCLDENTDAYNTIRGLLEFSYPKTIGMLKDDYKKCERNIERESKDYYDSLKLSIQNLAKIEAEIEAKDQELSEKMNMLANTDRGEEAKQAKAQNELLWNRKHSELVEIEAKLQNCITRKERQETEKSKLVIVDEDTLRIQRYLSYAQIIYERMKNNYGKKEKEYRDKLQKCMNDIFEVIYDGQIKILIDEKYRISVKVEEDYASNDELEKNTAQSYALIFAFIAAVIALAKRKVNDNAIDDSEKIDEDKEGYPLVMDAPLSAFDTTRIKSICTEMPRIADQVIIFIKDTDGNVAEEYMHERIGAKYLAYKVNGSNIQSAIEKEDI